MSTFIILFALLSASVSSLSVPNTKIPFCNLVNVRNCLKTMISDMMTTGMPTTDEKIEEQCRKAQQTRNCFYEFFSKCTSDFYQSLLFASASEYGRYYDEYCKSESLLRQQYKKNAACLGKAYRSVAMNLILEDWMTSLNEAFNTEPTARQANICCSSQRFYLDSIAFFKSNCGDDAAKSIEDFTKAFSSLPSSLCSTLGPDSTHCKEFLPPRGEPYQRKNTDMPVVLFFFDILQDKKHQNQN